MKFERFAFAFFLLGIFLVESVLAENVNGEVEWRVLNISEENVTENYTENPMINNSPQLDVYATMDATNWWAEVQLNESSIDFGHVEKGKAYDQKYKIWARGSIDISIKPILKKSNSIFSNLKMGRTKSSMSSIENYNINFINLSKMGNQWSIVGTNGTELNGTKPGHNGEQIIRLDLTNFEGIIPFEIPMENTIIFQINPIWSSVEPIPPEKVYKEFVEDD